MRCGRSICVCAEQLYALRLRKELYTTRVQEVDVWIKNKKQEQKACKGSYEVMKKNLEINKDITYFNTF
jgi:hypothetical protein